MNITLTARKGMKWALTELGAEQPRVRAKFEVNSPHNKVYEKVVPSSWYKKGYVIEVKEE